MNRHHLLPLLLLATMLVGAVPDTASAHDWIYRPSTFSHSYDTGQRVNQFTPHQPVFAPQRNDYVRSGFHQTRSSINIGGSQEQYHIVERWGEPVRPYGEWLYPYRPYAVPYDAWGPPFGGVNGDFQDRGLRRGIDGRGRFRGRNGVILNLNPGGIPIAPGDGDVIDSRRNFEQRRRSDARVRGLHDGQGIPGDDQHYLEGQRDLDVVPDRQFYRRPSDFRP